MVEDFDSLLPHCLDPVNADERVFVKVGQALVQGLHSRGADTTYARTLPRRLRDAGLEEVGASGQVTVYSGGSAASRLQVANIDQVGGRLVDAGFISSEERGTFRRLLEDPSFMGNHPLMITAWARKPH